MKKKICVTIPSLHGAGCERMLSEVLPYYTSEFDVDLLLVENKISYSIPDDINIICLDKSSGKSGAPNRVAAASTMLFSLILFFSQKKIFGYCQLSGYLQCAGLYR